MKAKILMPAGELVEGEIPAWKTPYNHNTRLESARVALYCQDESLTKQEFKDETDINVILQRFMKTGEPPPMPLPEHFTDVTGRTSYFEMASKVATAQESFYLLPAAKRAEYQNDPTRWADAVVAAVDAGDRDALAGLGIDVPQAPTPEATRKAQEPPKPTPAGEGSPAPGSGKAAPEAPQAGTPKGPNNGAKD